jgi:hypothetical protein
MSALLALARETRLLSLIDLVVSLPLSTLYVKYRLVLESPA